MVTTEEAIIELQTTNAALIAAVNVSKSSIESSIASAVIVSENAAIEPLISMASKLVDTQTIFINYLNT